MSVSTVSPGSNMLALCRRGLKGKETALRSNSIPVDNVDTATLKFLKRRKA